MQAHEPLLHAKPRPLTRLEYERIVEQGLFEGERLELIRGMVLEMSPIGPAHCDPIDVLTEIFIRALQQRALVRVQLPFAATDDSEPQPDLALVPYRRYSDRHPDKAFLLVEVAESSLLYDRETKGPLYAASGVPEYWIVNVNSRRVEVYDQPIEGRYSRARLFEGRESVAPQAFPDIVIQLSELFPR